MFDHDTIGRLVRSVLADEVARLTGRSAQAASAGWSEKTRIDEEGLGLDSLARLEVVARLTRFLHLHETGVEDYLVIRPTIGEWVEIAAFSLGQTLKAPGPAGAGAPHAAGGSLSFATSGSTGTPTLHAHSLATLIDEIDAAASVLGEVSRVIGLTPPHHIYGFLFSVLLPWRLGIDVLDARASAPGRVLALAEAGDLVVATPFLWDLVTRSGGRAGNGVTGLSSGAPADPGLWDRTYAARVQRLVEIYGSTETAGVGWRDDPSDGFTLFEHLDRSGESRIVRCSDRGEIVPPDRLEWTDAGRFRPVSRRDGAVQIGGVNVFPDRISEVITEHPDVAECAVRLDPDLGRLKAFVVLATPGMEGDELEDAMRAYCAERLSAPERPMRFAFGPALPRTDIGKLADWD